MNPMIQIQPRTLGGEAIQTVNARDLHGFLGLARDFNQWMREQIERARLVDGRDFQSYEDVGLGPRARREYALTLDAAKHIGMMSGTDKGFEVRDYFIECERRALAPPQHAIPQTLSEALRLAADQAERIEVLEHRIQDDAPKVAALERFAGHEGQHSIRTTAKLLGLREKLLIPWMIGHDWLYRDHGGRLSAKAGRLADGCLDTVPVEIMRSTGIHTVAQPMVTQKGLTRLAVLLARDGLIPKPEAPAKAA